MINMQLQAWRINRATDFFIPKTKSDEQIATEFAAIQPIMPPRSARPHPRVLPAPLPSPAQAPARARGPAGGVIKTENSRDPGSNHIFIIELQSGQL
jgi:hypothetical protein